MKDLNFKELETKNLVTVNNEIFVIVEKTSSLALGIGVVNPLIIAANEEGYIIKSIDSMLESVIAAKRTMLILKKLLVK